MLTIDGKYCGPYSREIGRAFINKGISAFAILNIPYDLSTQSIKSPLIATLYDEEKRLRILNVGCGGCGDIPLLDKEIKFELTCFLGIASPEVCIENVDNDSNLVSKVKEKRLTYFRLSDLIYINSRKGLNRSRTLRKVDNYITDSFEKTGNKEDLFISGMAGDTEIQADTYTMKKTTAEGIEISVADVQNLPYINESFDLILAHNFFNQQGLDINKSEQYIREMFRVLRWGGIIFPNYGLYRKRRKSFEKLTAFYFPRFGDLRHLERSKAILPMEISGDDETVFSLEDYEKVNGCYCPINFDKLLLSFRR